MIKLCLEWQWAGVCLQYNRVPRQMQNFILDMPPVTRLLMLQQIIGLGIEYSGYIPRYDLYFNFDKIFYEGEVKNKCNLGVEVGHQSFLPQENRHIFVLRNHLHVCLSLESYHMFKNLERGFNRGSIDFLFLITVIISAIYGLAWAMSINYLGFIFKYVIYYLYGRTNYDHIIHINLIPVRAPFLIWLLFLIDWVVDTPQIKSMAIGIILGHTLFFLIKVYPNLYYSKNGKPLDTPEFFIDIMSPFFREEDRVQRPAEELWG